MHFVGDGVGLFGAHGRVHLDVQVGVHGLLVPPASHPVAGEDPRHRQGDLLHLVNRHRYPVHQGGGTLADDVYPDLGDNQGDDQGQDRVGQRIAQAHSDQTTEHGEGDKDVGTGVQGVGHQHIAVQAAARPQFIPHHSQVDDDAD